MIKPASALRIFLSFALLLQLVACAMTPHSVAVPGPGYLPSQDEIFVGARVEVTTFEGKVMEFEVLEILPDGLRGEQGSVPFAEMRSLYVLRPSVNGGWILAVILVAALAVVATQSVPVFDDGISFTNPNP